MGPIGQVVRYVWMGVIILQLKIVKQITKTAEEEKTKIKTDNNSFLCFLTYFLFKPMPVNATPVQFSLKVPRYLLNTSREHYS